MNAYICKQASYFRAKIYSSCTLHSATGYGISTDEAVWGRVERFSIGLGKQPIVMLLDLKMPKVDGLTALRTIKNEPQFTALPSLC
jgi:CheY-like chemotaxis protein